MNVGIFPNPDGRGGNTLATADLFSAGFYAKDRIVISPVSYQFYVKKVSGNTTADPSADSTNWAILGTPARKSYQEFEISFALGETVKTGTITAITSKYRLWSLGVRGTGGNDINDVSITIEYTNSTTITARRSASPGPAATIRGAVEDFW